MGTSGVHVVTDELRGAVCCRTPPSSMMAIVCLLVCLPVWLLPRLLLCLP